MKWNLPKMLAAGVALLVVGVVAYIGLVGRGTGAQALLLASFRENYWDIYQLDADGTLTNLTWHQALDDQPGWSPDGREIVFRSNRDGELTLYIMAADGTNIRRLTTHAAAGGEPAWGRRGVAFSSMQTGNSEIYILRDGVTDDAPHNLTNHPAADSQPSWSPDGERLVFISDRDGGLNLYTMRADGDDLRPVTRGLSARYPVWLAEGIAFVAWDGGGFALHLIDPDGTNLRRITDVSNNRLARLGDEVVMMRPDGVYACTVTDCQPRLLLALDATAEGVINRDLAGR